MNAVEAPVALPEPVRAPGPDRFPLDTVRALAAIAVLVFHAYQTNLEPDRPWTGWAHSLMLASDSAVDMFFVISGFLLWLPVASALLAGRGQRSGRQLLVRRAVRLLPLYVVVLLIAWSLANPVLPGNWQDLVMHLTMTHVYSDTSIFWTVGPAWTLAVEFHAYVLVALLLPLLTAVTPRLRTAGQRLVVAAGIPAVLGAVGLTYLLVAALVLRVPETQWSVWFGPLAKAHLFAVGMGLAVLGAQRRVVGPGWRRALVVLGVAFLGGGLALRTGFDPVTAELSHILYAGASSMFVSAIVFNPGRQPAWLTWRPLVFVGTVSFSLYLVHELVMHTLRDLGLLPPVGTSLGVVVTAAATFAVALTMARFSYQLVEKPLQAVVHGLEHSDQIYQGPGSEPARSTSVRSQPVGV